MAAIYIALTVGGAILSAWIAFEIAVANTRYTFIGRGILLPMMDAAVIGATVVPIAFFAYGALRHREA